MSSNTRSAGFKSISIEEAVSHIGKVVRCDKRQREFVAKLIAVEDDILVFETKAGKILRDPCFSIGFIQELV